MGIRHLYGGLSLVFPLKSISCTDVRHFMTHGVLARVFYFSWREAKTKKFSRNPAPIALHLYIYTFTYKTTLTTPSPRGTKCPELLAFWGYVSPYCEPFLNVTVYVAQVQEIDFKGYFFDISSTRFCACSVVQTTIKPTHNDTLIHSLTPYSSSRPHIRFSHARVRVCAGATHCNVLGWVVPDLIGLNDGAELLQI